MELFEEVHLRNIVSRNRLVVPPMCQYSAHEGFANDWHLVHLGRFATGGMGIIFAEATAVEKRGRITHGDLGLWSDEHIESHSKLAHFIHLHGAVPAIQLGHAGRKASMQRPWAGNGPLDDVDISSGDMPWEIVGPSDAAVSEGFIKPTPLETNDISDIVDAFSSATYRAYQAGYRALEIHGAHGYLIHSFLSPLSNHRNDKYGGDLKGRMRLALEVTEAVRGAWPVELPLFFRVSSVDDVDGGWTLNDTVSLASELKTLGVDVIDCSSGGIAGSATAARTKRQAGYQVPFAKKIREEAGLMTQAVGLITNPMQASTILKSGSADLIAVGREVLDNPTWALHAARQMGLDESMESWPQQYGWWLSRRAKSSILYSE